MILNIQGPKDSISTTIQVSEIVRLETCVLNFFGNKFFNLYIILKAEEDDENFHLFPYAAFDDFQDAHSKIVKILKDTSESDNIINITPSPGSGIIREKATA